MTSYCPVPGVGPETPADHDYEGGFAAALMLKDLQARDGSGAERRRLHADGRRSRGALPALRRPRRRRQGFLRHHQDDRRQLEGARTNRRDHAHRPVRMPLASLLAAAVAAIGQANNAQASAAILGRAGCRIARSDASAARRCKVMHERHEGMETIGKANKALHRELDGELARPRRGPRVRRDHRQACRARRRAGSPPGTGPDVGKTGAKPEIWQNRQDFAAKLARLPGCRAGVQRGRRGRRRERDQGAVRATSAGTCKACHDNYRVGDAPLSDAGVKQPRLGPAGPAGPLAARRADRVQLVVGPQPPHRLAHLVGLRDPDPADLPPAVGLRRKLDRALRQLRARPARRCATICAAAGRGIGHTPLGALSVARLARRRRGPGRARPDLARTKTASTSGPLATLVSIDTSDKARDIHELWFNVVLGADRPACRRDHLLPACAASS